MRKLSYLLFLGLVIASVSVAFAYHHNHGLLGAELGDMDGNDDGVITYEEFDEFYSTNVRAIFDALDSDKDGTISPEEWEAFLEIHGYGSHPTSSKNS